MRFLTLIGLMFAGVCLTSFGVEVLRFAGLSQYWLLYASSILQGVLAFMLPSIIIARKEDKQNPVRWLKMSHPAGRKAWFLSFLTLLASIPAMNWIINWNASVHLPESLQYIEQALREMENLATATTNIMLSDTSVFGLIWSVLIVGVFTGLCEEMFFRGTMLPLISKHLGRHAGIWITAIIFSAIHFQFFGFVPRLLLGALFGYIYYWTGSLFTSAGTHALNNSLAVISYWIMARGGSFDLENIGISESMIPSVAAIISIVITGFILYLFHLYGKKNSLISRNNC